MRAASAAGGTGHPLLDAWTAALVATLASLLLATLATALTFWLSRRRSRRRERTDYLVTVINQLRKENARIDRDNAELRRRVAVAETELGVQRLLHHRSGGAPPPPEAAGGGAPSP